MNGAVSPRVQAVPLIYHLERPRTGFGDCEYRRDDGDRPAGVMILIARKRSAFHQRTVHLTVRVRVVAASNMGQAD